MTLSNTEEIIERTNKYISMMRMKYYNLERLSRLQRIDMMSKRLHYTTEKLNSKIESAEQLSKDFKLPLKVRGVFLTEGRPKAKYYLAEELEKSVSNPMNASFPLMIDHRDREALMVKGKVDKIKYDPKRKALLWWGHINDETFARNVLDGAITEVSATIYSVSDYDDIHGLVGRDLVFKELSLVMKGAEPNNYIEVDR